MFSLDLQLSDIPTNQPLVNGDVGMVSKSLATGTASDRYAAQANNKFSAVTIACLHCISHDNMDCVAHACRQNDMNKETQLYHQLLYNGLSRIVC